MTADIYKNNRQKLVEKLPKAEYIMVVGNSQMARSRDTAYKFRQDSNVLYLSGINEPKISIFIDVNRSESLVVVPDQTKTEQIFEGTPNWADISKSAGLDGFIEQSELRTRIKDAKELFMNFPNRVNDFGISNNPYRADIFKKIKSITGIKPKDARMALAELRVIKQPYEIDNIKKAISITKNAIVDVFNDNAALHTEKDYENLITAYFAKNGAEHAYLPIVASGANASVLHHLPSNKSVLKNQALLFDVGAEIDGYSADISRTYVVGENSFQQSIIDEVKQVQTQLISMLKPGVYWKEFHTSSVKMLSLVITNKKLGNENSVKELFPHSIGHFVGLDTHDIGDYTKPLEKGMVLTVEPGVYSKASGFGVRIEDEVLITSNGAQIL